MSMAGRHYKAICASYGDDKTHLVGVGGRERSTDND